ncbi:unnamed protein product, partial [Iphiclides podalirius]
MLWTDGVSDGSRHLFRFPEILHTLLALLLHVMLAQCGRTVNDLMTFVGLMRSLSAGVSTSGVNSGRCGSQGGERALIRISRGTARDVNSTGGRPTKKVTFIGVLHQRRVHRQYQLDVLAIGFGYGTGNDFAFDTIEVAPPNHPVSGIGNNRAVREESARWQKADAGPFILAPRPASTGPGEGVPKNRCADNLDVVNHRATATAHARPRGHTEKPTADRHCRKKRSLCASD